MTRRGAHAVYLDIDHPDYPELLQIRDIGNPMQNLFYAACIPDYWMQDMLNGDVNKRQLWADTLQSRKEKGLPYIFFSDNVNKGKPQIYKELNARINGSNLCAEIALPSNNDESFVCCLASMNLELYDEWKDSDAVFWAILFLDAVLQEFIDKTKELEHFEPAHKFAERHRAVGLGVMGWHSYLQKNNIAFEDFEAMQLNNSIFKHISKQAMAASIELGQEMGVAPIFNEVPDSQDTPRRNTTTMAIAPTTSSSSILGGASPGIEPFSSNYYKVGLAKGNFMRKNKYLDAKLTELGKNNEDVWRDILLHHGSVQHLSFLDDKTKRVFKTFRELSQMSIIQQAAQRQRYIDQMQSINLNIPSEMSPKDVHQLLVNAWQMGVKSIYYQRSESVAKELITNMVICNTCEA